MEILDLYKKIKDIAKENRVADEIIEYVALGITLTKFANRLNESENKGASKINNLKLELFGKDLIESNIEMAKTRLKKFIDATVTKNFWKDIFKNILSNLVFAILSWLGISILIISAVLLTKVSPMEIIKFFIDSFG